MTEQYEQLQKAMQQKIPAPEQDIGTTISDQRRLPDQKIVLAKGSRRFVVCKPEEQTSLRGIACVASNHIRQ
jgi:hypothetical protein